MNWIISGPITVSVEVVDTDDPEGARRNVCFEVTMTDDEFAEITERWRASFEETAWQAYERSVQ